jgi:glycosyltransferase involved in cell wall biosynthesis
LVAAGIDAEVAISHFVAQAVEGSPTVIHNGVAPADQAALAGRTAVVLQRLEPEKRGDVAIEAWAASTLPGRGWTLLVAGRGRLETELREIANSRGVSSSVRFLGHVSSTLELLGNASLMIAPAPEEPFGLAVVEAMAHGVPVIAASGGAHRETVAVPELLFPPGDVQACASILDQLADDPGQRSAVGQRLRDRQRELFLLEDHVDSLSRLYEGLL